MLVDLTVGFPHTVGWSAFLECSPPSRLSSSSVESVLVGHAPSCPPIAPSDADTRKALICEKSNINRDEPAFSGFLKRAIFCDTGGSFPGTEEFRAVPGDQVGIV